MINPKKLGRSPVVVAVVVASFVFTGIIMIAWQSYRMIDRELTAAALSRRVAVSDLAAATLSEKFDHLIDISISLATRVRFRQLVAAGQWAEAIEILRDVPRDLPVIERLFLTDTAGTLTADVPVLPGVRGKSFAYRGWYKGVSRDGKPYVSPAYQRAAVPQVNVFAVAVPIRTDSGNVSGILVLQVRLDTFFEWLKAIEIGPEGFVYVVDAEGQLAFHSKFPGRNEIVKFSAVPAVQRVLRGARSVGVTFDPVEKEVAVSAYTPVSGYGWGVIVQQPAQAAFTTKNEQLARLLVAYGLVLLFCVLVAYLVSRVIVQRRQAEDDRRVKVELERRVAERTAQLEAANKELESFSYSVAHDLRSPLRAIDGYSQMLEEDYTGVLDDEGRRLLTVVRSSSRKMAALIDDLLAFSRLGRQPLTIAEFDMDAMVREVLKELPATPGARPPDWRIGKLPQARGDRTLVRQVWINLLSNAAKFSAGREQPTMEIGGYPDGDTNVYYVQDNGAGFDMQYYDKLFGVFQRLHSAEEFPGTGVGLAIVKRVVVRQGGRAWAEGELDKGATFYFSLPKGGQNV
jgi:signal transduction histidine kinase